MTYPHDSPAYPNTLKALGPRAHSVGHRDYAATRNLWDAAAERWVNMGVDPRYVSQEFHDIVVFCDEIDRLAVEAAGNRPPFWLAEGDTLTDVSTGQVYVYSAADGWLPHAGACSWTATGRTGGGDMTRCRRCGLSLPKGEFAFGSTQNGWEHLPQCQPAWPPPWPTGMVRYRLILRDGGYRYGTSTHPDGRYGDVVEWLGPPC